VQASLCDQADGLNFSKHGVKGDLKFDPQRRIRFEKRQQFLEALRPFGSRRRFISRPAPIN
jgi:hypothetical protein